MKRTLYLTLLLVSTLGGWLSVCGQELPQAAVSGLSESGEISTPIYFPIGQSTIDPDFMGNRSRMDAFVETLRRILADPDYAVTKVRVVGMASPDGARERNEELAGARARALADYLTSATALPEERIEVVNGGENWAGLFSMIEASTDIPDKEKMLEFREIYGSDRDRLKRNMQYYNGTRAWTYMYEHFFPILRTGAGGASGMDAEARLSTLSRGNWEHVRALVRTSDLDAKTEQALLDELDRAESDPKSDSRLVMERLRMLCPDETVYTTLEHKAVASLLGESSAVSTDNWTLLRERIAQSTMEERDAVLDIIDHVPAAGGREQQLRALNDGAAYRQIERLYPELLTDLQPVRPAGIACAPENWQTLRAKIVASDLPDKEEVLSVIDGEADLDVREEKLRALNGGATYAKLSDEMLPELLFGSGIEASQQEANRAVVHEQVAVSDIPYKEEALEILSRESDPVACAAQLRALGDGETYRRIVAEAVPALLAGNAPVAGSAADLMNTPIGLNNWQTLRAKIAASDLPDKEEVLSVIDGEADLDVREEKLRALNGGATYAKLSDGLLPELLFGDGVEAPQQAANRALVVNRIAGSDLPDKDAVLSILSEESDPATCAAQLRALDDGATYDRVVALAAPALLSNAAAPVVNAPVGLPSAAVGPKNWQTLRAKIAASDLPDKEEVLSVIDGEADLDVREEKLRALNGGATYAKLSDGLLPELLFGDGVEAPQQAANRALVVNRIAGSDLPDKDAVLSILSEESDPATCAAQLRALDDGATYDRVVALAAPALLSNAAAPVANAPVELPSAAVGPKNWQTLRAKIAASDLPDKEEVLAVIDGEPDLEARNLQLRALADGAVYDRVLDLAFSELLTGGDAAVRQEANRAYILDRISDSDIANKDAVLSILSEQSDAATCVEELRALDDGDTYRRIVAEIVPSLLRPADPVSEASTTTVSAANWQLLREMVAASDMPDRETVLSIIDDEPDAVVRERRLRELNDGSSDRYIKEVFFPELLYGLSPAAKENWNLLERTVDGSDIENREAVLEILRDTPPGVAREEAIRSLDDGRTWEEISRQMLPELLQNTEDIEVSGTGMSFTYEASPAAKAREEEQRQQQLRAREEEWARREEARRTASVPTLRETLSSATPRSGLKVSLKTDLVLWGSLMPGFEMGGWTPNLSVEFGFADRWSVQVGGAYSNWNALGGDYGLYALTAVDVEPRFWMKRDGAFRGLYGGLYGTFGDFDRENKDATGTTGTFFIAGLSCGWLQPFGSHWFLDAGVRLGYRMASVDDYTVIWGHSYWDRSESRGKFVPQVRLQIGYRFGKSAK